MVQYDAEIYNQEEQNITGVKVVIASDVGDVIETIQVTNKTDFDEIISQLENIDETYIRVAEGSSLAGERLDTILANTGSAININASKLGGHSDTYYSPVVHSHTAGDINNLYQYEISLSNYHPQIGESVRVTVKVTNYNDTPVNQKLITINKDNVAWAKNVTTNSSGTYSKTFTPTTAGVVTFSIKGAQAQCNVQDAWKQVPLNKNVSFECNLWVLESQKLANLVMYIPRYVGWCKTTSTDGMKPDEIDPVSIRFISENKDAVSASKRKYLFNGSNTEEVLPSEYAPTRTISQPLYKSNYVVYLHRDGSISGMAREYSTDSNVNWSVDVHFNQVWRYGNEE